MAITINGNNAATAGGIGYGDGTNLVFTNAGTSGQVLVSAGAGAPTWSSTVPTVNLTTGVTGTLPIANGGTNTTATPTAGAVPYGTGTALAYTAAGTSGQVLTSAGSGAPTWTTLSAGGMTVIASVTPTTAQTYTYTNLAAYKQIIVIMSNVGIGSGGLSNGRVSFSSDNGSTYSAVIAFTNTSSSSLTGRLDIFNTNSSTANKPWTSFQSASSPSLGFDTTSGVVNAIKVESSNPLNSTGLIFVAGIL